MIQCQTCGKETVNPKFCSRNCAAKTNNILTPRRKRTNKCKFCKVLIYSDRVYCTECYKNPIAKSKYRLYKNNIITKEDIDKVMEERRQIYLFHAPIRANARKTYFDKFKNKICEKCNYDKHIEVSHIKPVKDFDKNTPVKIINDLNNLVGLCPNCHWELDNNLFDITEIERFKILPAGFEPAYKT